MKYIFIILTSLLVASEAKRSKAMPFNANHVNLSLETAFIFDPKDAYYDITLIKSLRDFLESLEGQLSKRSELRSAPKRDFKVSDFIYELGRHLLGYNNQNVHTFTLLLQDVVEDYYPTEIFNKIFYDPRLRSFVKNSLKEWVATDPKVIKDVIKSMYERPTYNETFTNFIFNLNELFPKDNEAKLKKLAAKFEKFPEKQSKLRKYIEQTINYIIFDKYKILSFNQTADLIKYMSPLAEYVMIKFPSKSMVPEESYNIARNSKRASENITVFQDMERHDKSLIHLFPAYGNKFPDSDREEFAINLNDSLESKKKNTNEMVGKEILVSKEININVEKKVDDIDNSTDNEVKPRVEDDSVSSDGL